MINLIVVILLCQKKCRNSHCTCTDQRHLDWLKWIGVSKKDCNQRQKNRENCFNQKHGCCTSNIVYYTAPLIHNVRHCSKIRIKQYYICYILSRIASCRHGNTAVCLFQCKYIIYAVTGHGNCMLLSLKCLYHLFLLLWSHSSKYTAFSYCALHFLRCCNSCGVNIMICILQPCLLCNCGNCHRVISGNNFQIDTLAVKECQRIRCFRTNHICNKEQTDRFQTRRSVGTFCFLFAVCENQNTESIFCIGAAMCQKFLISFRKEKLCSAHQISSPALKYSTTVFSI